AQIAMSPDIRGLTPAEICSIVNFKVASSCHKKLDVVRQPPAPRARTAETSSQYDVVEKTIGQLRADMESGRTTSQEITQAYLDRIEFYDKGQFGFHAYEVVAADAMKQAKAADDARKAGKKGTLLGIPIAAKNL